MDSEQAAKFSKLNSKNGRNQFFKTSISSSPMLRFLAPVNPKSKASSIRLITSGSNSIRVFVNKLQEFTEYENFDECLKYVEECMIKHAPIDGLLGFSQGAILSAALAGLQAKGIALTKVPKIKFIIIISGAKLKNESWAEKAYSLPIQCPSLHFLGDNDFLKPYGTELLKSVENPMVVHHPKGHTIPRLDEKGLETMLKFTDRIQKIVNHKEDVVNKEAVVMV